MDEDGVIHMREVLLPTQHSTRDEDIRAAALSAAATLYGSSGTPEEMRFVGTMCAAHHFEEYIRKGTFEGKTMGAWIAEEHGR